MASTWLRDHQAPAPAEALRPGQPPWQAGVGLDGLEAIYWSRLIYIPHPKTLNKNVSKKVKEWVRLSEFEIALDEQMEKVKQIAIKRCINALCLDAGQCFLGTGMVWHIWKILFDSTSPLRVTYHTKTDKLWGKGQIFSSATGRVHCVSQVVSQKSKFDAKR